MSPLVSAAHQYLVSLSLRERVLLLAVILSVFYTAWDGLILAPQQQQYQRLLEQKAQLEQKQQQILQTLSEKNLSLAQMARLRQDKEKAVFLAQAELEKTSQQLNDVLSQLVPPTQITDLLQSLLLKTQGLKLLELNNEPVKTITLAAKEGKTAEPEDQPSYNVLYQHTTVIKLAGNYSQLYQYLKEIEQSKWSLYWDSLDYHVTEYPRAEITLRVHTVSTDKYWIGL